jgi:hypothetical protein
MTVLGDWLIVLHRSRVAAKPLRVSLRILASRQATKKGAADFSATPYWIRTSIVKSRELPD